jgi:uncharacterized protein YdcH (DUF465 family)
MEDQRIKEILIEKNQDFRQMYLKHQEFEKQLREMDGSQVNTEAQLVETRRIKKQKLKLKDAMQKFIIEYRDMVQ